MRLIPFVQRACFGVAAHAGRTCFVDNASGSFQPIIVFRGSVVARKNDRSHLMHDFAEGFLHVFGLFDLVFAPFYIEAQRWNAVFINGIRVNFAEIAFQRNGFATARHTYPRTVIHAVVLF